MTTSLNGRPYPSPKLVTLPVPGTKRRLTVDAEVGPILVAFAADYHKRIRPIDVGPVDEGAYCDRPARGAPTRKSNHANGSAVDINYSQEGRQGGAWGRKFFADAVIKVKMRKLLKEYAPVLAWGGAWRALDFMHIEIAPGVSAAQIHALKDRLGITSMGVRTK